MKPPHYQDIAATDIPQLALENSGYIKVIARNYVAESETIVGAVQGVTTQFCPPKIPSLKRWA